MVNPYRCFLCHIRPTGVIWSGAPDALGDLIPTCQPVEIAKLAKEETDNDLPNDVFIGAAVSLLPAIVRATSLMPVRRLTLPIGPHYV